MGLGASQARLLMLTARKSNLELNLQFINQARMQISNMVSGLYNQQSNLEPDSANAQRLNAQISSVQQRDKQLEMESKRIDTQHQTVQTEIEAVSKVINKNIEGSFKLMG
jgi:uncharacterized protein (DUF3084 family)